MLDADASFLMLDVERHHGSMVAIVRGNPTSIIQYPVISICYPGTSIWLALKNDEPQNLSRNPEVIFSAYF